MQSISLNNVVGPFSTVSKMSWPSNSGFILTPAETSSSPGWGFPIYPNDDSTQARIFPGTYGADGQRTTLTTIKGQWKERKTEELQSGGSIDWWGPAPDSKPGSKRVVISYNGPKSRHFPDGFRYGESKKDNNVYMSGGIVGIAPGPVTGACLRPVAEADPEYVLHKHRLLVVCLEAGKEIVYIRLLPTVVYENKMTESAEKLLSRKYDPVNPKLEGWRKIADTDIVGYDAPESPWFFNKSGTEAQCIRVKDFTFSPNSDGEVTQKIGHRFKLTVSSDTSASSSNLKNLEPFEYIEKGSKTFKGNWTPDVLDADGNSHTWEEMEVKSYNTMKGSQVVAVDYLDDAEVVVTLIMDSTVGFTKDYMKGMDSYTDPQIMTNKNRYYNYISKSGASKRDLGCPAVHTSGDHRAGLWIVSSQKTYLQYTVASQKYTVILESAYQTDNNDVENTLTHSFNDRCYVRFLDVRSNIVFVTIDRTDWYAEVFKIYPKAAEAYSADLTSDEGTSYVFFADSGPLSATSITSARASPLRFASDVDYAEANALPNGEWEWKYKTYTGKKPTTNDGNSKGKYNSFYHLHPEDYQSKAGYVGMGMLRHDRYTQESGVAITPEMSMVANLNVPDPASTSKTKKLYTVHSADIDPVTLAGGERLYPLGIM